MLTWLIGLRFLQGRVPHHQHHPLLLAVGILQRPTEGSHASGIRTGRWFQGQVQHHDRLFDRRIRERPLQPGQEKARVDPDTVASHGSRETAPVS